jgi:hypothetical protein
MEIKEKKELAAMVADEVMKKLRNVHNLSETEYVDTDEAARILGISPNYLRSVKNRYPHIKAGDSKQGRILFRRDSLFNQFKV